MKQTYKLTFLDENVSVEARKNETLMESMKEAGIFLDAPCAGQGTCGKCLVRISADTKNWETVKACQTKIVSDLWVDTRKSPRKYHILTTSSVRKVPYEPSLPEKIQMNGRERGYLAAFDIGTTTIAAYLLDGQNGEQRCTASCLNPQAAYGADVISRANYNLEHGSRELADCIHRAIDGLIGELSQKAGIKREQIIQICLVGNTCMHHIFFQYPMDSLVRAPYKPYQRGLIRDQAAKYQIHIHPQGELIFLPVIAGFVGADTMGCILTIQPDHKEEITLMLDIGTNGELVLGNKKKLICCSTAAGPAFEGAKIECGMRGAQGAIDHVTLADGFHYSVIGGENPKGICGSGLIDAIAILLHAGLIEPSGRLLTPEEAVQVNESLGRHVAVKDGKPVFLFDLQQDSVYLTQKDIREVQLAKGAISAGILLMEKELGISHEQIQTVYIAGAFGNYMDPGSACDIGLLPPELADRVIPVGNAAGEGAKLALMNRKEMERTELLMNKVEFLELAGIPEFQDCFVDELEFPEQDKEEE